MSLESDLNALLLTISPNVYPDVAAPGAALPYVVWQEIGGQALRYGDGTAPDKRNAYLQVAVWSSTRGEALALIRQIEEVFCLSSIFAAISPSGEAISAYEPDTERYGSIQRFDIWATR